MKNALCIFAKTPEVGQVKTRLGKEIGMEPACELYQAFLRDLAVEHINQDYALFFCTPNPSGFEVPGLIDLHHQIRVVEQAQGDLGNRLSQAFSLLFSTFNMEKVVVIGSDMPHLSSVRITQSFQQLDSHDVVLGPTQDGGYYLVGLKEVQPIFSDISWSSSKVFEQTEKVVKNKNLTLFTLPTDFDVDKKSDLSGLFSKKGISNTQAVLRTLHDIDHHTDT